MAQNEKLAELSAAGVAVWLDDLSRDRIRSGNLQQLRRRAHVVGVTTNPTIFQRRYPRATRTTSSCTTWRCAA